MYMYNEWSTVIQYTCTMEYWLYNVHVQWNTGYTMYMYMYNEWSTGYTIYMYNGILVIQCTFTLHVLIYRSSVKPRTATLELTTKPR